MKWGWKKFHNAKKSQNSKTYHNILCSNFCLDSRNIYPLLPIFIQCAFFDPGTTSCGLRIVRYYLDIQKIDVIWCSVLEFGNTHETINKNIDLILEDIKLYLQDCHHILIEHQIMKCNLTHRFFAAIIYYITNFICPFRMKPIFFEVNVALKTTFLGGPRNKKENNSLEMKEWVSRKKGLNVIPIDGSIEIKEWTKMKSEMICIEREDYLTQHILDNSLYKAVEDISDVICYEYAWIIYIFKENVYIPYNI